MKRYEVVYDYHDEIFGVTTLKERARTYEEAEQMVADLKQNDLYSNIKIEYLYGEY